jgi:hypothetical protein
VDRAALKLSGMGKSAEAVEVAMMINDQALRDGLLSKLSSGSWDKSIKLWRVPSNVPAP